MPTKDKQIAQEAMRKLAQNIGVALLTRENISEITPTIEAELHRAFDPLLEAAKKVPPAFGEHHNDPQGGCYTELLFACQDLRKELLKWLK